MKQKAQQGPRELLPSRELQLQPKLEHGWFLTHKVYSNI